MLREQLEAASDYANDRDAMLDMVRRALGVPEEPHQGMDERILEAALWHATVAASRGPIADIAEERDRQIGVEGWTPAHDDQHHDGELSAAAGCYAFTAVLRTGEIEHPEDGMNEWRFWPWDSAWWKPSREPRRNLVKAGALIVAELERLNRANRAEANVVNGELDENGAIADPEAYEGEHE